MKRNAEFGIRIAELGAFVGLETRAFPIDPGTMLTGIISFQRNRQVDKETGRQGECRFWIADCGMRIQFLISNF